MLGHILKMQTTLGEPGKNQAVQYQLPIDDALLPMNEHIGQTIQLHYQNEIHCVACGRTIKKSFAQGHCYPCFRRLASCDMCIMRPETCHYVQGTCRQPEWGEVNCFIPHYVYLANSSGIKVGITRGTQIPTRWMDQGASQALPIFRVASRLQSGLIEVVIKKHISDRTDWRKMLKGEAEPLNLQQIRDELMAKCSAEIEAVISTQSLDNNAASDIEAIDEAIVEIKYPVTEYPKKVKSLNFDKQPEIEGLLQGIKGQYLIMDVGVLNIRKFSGYKIQLDFI